jgi:hypothetical protein
MTHARCCCGDSGGEVACDVPEYPCSALVRISGVSPSTIAPSEFSTVDDFEVLQFSGLNGVHRIRLDGNGDDEISFLLVIRATRTNSEGVKQTVTQTFTRATVGGGQILCDPERDVLCLGSVSLAVGSTADSVEVENGPWPWSFGTWHPGSPGSSPLRTNEVHCLGVSVSDFRTPPPTPWDSSTPGALWLPFSGSSQLIAWIFDCPPEEQPRTFWAEPCEPGERITVDLNTNTESKWSPKIGAVLYKLTDEQSDQPAQAVEWVNEICEQDQQPGDGQLWERCRVDGVFYTPSGFMPPNRVRISNEITTSQVARMTIAGPYYQTGTPGEQCQDFAAVHYHLIDDDDGTYPSVGPGVPVQVGCSSTTDRFIRGVCSGDPSDPGDPTIPPGDFTPAQTDQDGNSTRFGMIDPNHDIAIEAKALKQGGDCGCSRYTDS